MQLSTIFHKLLNHPRVEAILPNIDITPQDLIEEKTDNLYILKSDKTIQVIDIMINTLEQHCGPYGSYALINNPFNPKEEPIFTKDGQHILNSLEFAEPEQKMIHKMVLYIGNKIANTVGDGTTTGMLITLNLLKSFFSMSNQAFNNFVATNTFIELQNYSNEIINKFIELVDHYKFTVENVKEATLLPKEDLIKSIAYAQAFTSSHGDREVAEAISEMFIKLPEESLSSIMFMRAGFETNERIKVKIEDYQYSCKADIFSAAMLNTDKRSKFYVENADVDLFNPTLVIEHIETEKIIRNLIDHYKENKNYVLITTGACSVTRTNIHKTFIDLHKEFPDSTSTVGIFFVPIVENLVNDIFCISLVGKIKYPSDTSVNSLSNLVVEFEKGELRISNLYDAEEHSDVHDNLRPMYNHPEYMNYAETIKHIEMKIARYRETGSTHNSMFNNDLKEYIRLKNNLLLNKRVSVLIGGNSYDNTTLFDIVEDCVNAVRKTLTKGFFPGGLISTIFIFKEIKAHFDNLVTDSEASYRRYTKIIDLLNYYLEAMINTANIFITDDHVAFDTYDNCYDVVSETSHDLFSMHTWDLANRHTNNIIIQPADTDLTIFRRIEEVILKIIYSYDFIFHG